MSAGEELSAGLERRRETSSRPRAHHAPARSGCPGWDSPPSCARGSRDVGATPSRGPELPGFRRRGGCPGGLARLTPAAPARPSASVPPQAQRDRSGSISKAKPRRSRAGLQGRRAHRPGGRRGGPGRGSAARRPWAACARGRPHPRPPPRRPRHGEPLPGLRQPGAAYSVQRPGPTLCQDEPGLEAQGRTDEVAHALLSVAASTRERPPRVPAALEPPRLTHRLQVRTLRPACSGRGCARACPLSSHVLAHASWLQGGHRAAAGNSPREGPEPVTKPAGWPRLGPRRRQTSRRGRRGQLSVLEAEVTLTSPSKGLQASGKRQALAGKGVRSAAHFTP